MRNVELAAAAFGLDLSGKSPALFGNGLIHTTWQVQTGEGPFVVQRLNSEVFPDPVLIAENAACAAARVDDAMHRRGDDDSRRRLVFRTDSNGRPWWRDDAGDVWRAAVLIENSRPADPTIAAEVRAAAWALGRFPGLVAEGKGPEPRVALPGFHDTAERLACLNGAVAADACDRFARCRVEAEYLFEHASLADRLSAGPSRLVHNDTKLDNVLVDATSGEALCVIDLDTVQPGLTAHDFGDLLRSAVSGRPEDEPDLKKITVADEAFLNLAAAYLEGAGEWIDGEERLWLFDGALVVTYEQALRFLTDFLVGDTYYSVEDAEHNLRRVRAQIQLLQELGRREEALRGLLAGI